MKLTRSWTSSIEIESPCVIVGREFDSLFSKDFNVSDIKSNKKKASNSVPVWLIFLTLLKTADVAIFDCLPGLSTVNRSNQTGSLMNHNSSWYNYCHWDNTQYKSGMDYRRSYFCCLSVCKKISWRPISCAHPLLPEVSRQSVWQTGQRKPRMNGIGGPIVNRQWPKSVTPSLVHTNQSGESQCTEVRNSVRNQSNGRVLPWALNINNFFTIYERLALFLCATGHLRIVYILRNW